MNSAERLQLTDITLCAVSGIFSQATIGALGRCLVHADFYDVVFITDQANCVAPAPIRTIRVDCLNSREAYSRFLLTQLNQQIQSRFVLLVQWDGFIARPINWTEQFLSYDYIGACWPQFPEDRSVGNGGFSLRSKRLLEACLDPRFEASHPEDLCICHQNRDLLEREHGIKFAPPAVAARFSYERMGDPDISFGFHGLFNLPGEVGMSEFLQILGTIDISLLGLREQVEIYKMLRARHPRDFAPRYFKRVFWRMVWRHWNRLQFWRLLIGVSYSPNP